MLKTLWMKLSSKLKEFNDALGIELLAFDGVSHENTQIFGIRKGYHQGGLVVVNVNLTFKPLLSQMLLTNLDVKLIEALDSMGVFDNAEYTYVDFLVGGDKDDMLLIIVLPSKKILNWNVEHKCFEPH